MSYQEKKRGANLGLALVILLAYCFKVYRLVQANAYDLNNLQATATLMLKYIGVSIVATIILQISFHILYSVFYALKNRDLGKEDIEKGINAEFVEDERDQLIELKSSRVGWWIAGGGFFIGIILAAFNYPVAIMLNITYIAYSIGSLSEEAVSLYFYRKGL